MRYEENPEKFPPTRVLNTQGNSVPANAWWNKISTVLTHGQNMLQVYAEYQRLSQVCSVAEHIKGIDNKIADNISCVQQLFTPWKTHIYDVPFDVLLAQDCQKHRKSKLWNIFLPSKQLLLHMISTVSSNIPTTYLEAIKVPGHCVRVVSILSSSAPKKYLLNYFL